MRTKTHLQLSQEAKEAVTTRIREAATAYHAIWPQYKGHWAGDAWKVIQVTRRVETKMGVAFEKNELTIARGEMVLGEMTVVAYSTRNNVDTSLARSDVRWL